MLHYSAIRIYKTWILQKNSLSDNGDSVAEWVTLTPSKKVPSSTCGVCMCFDAYGKLVIKPYRVRISWLCSHMASHLELETECSTATVPLLLRGLSYSIKDGSNADTSFCYEGSIKFTATLTFFSFFKAYHESVFVSGAYRYNIYNICLLACRTI